MKNKKLIIFMIILLFLVFISLIFFSVINMGNNNIFSKITINNINVSGKSKDEAYSILTKLSDQKKQTEIKLEYSSDDEKYEKIIDLSILNIDYNLDESIQKAYSTGRTGNIFQNNLSIAKAFFIHKNIDLKLSFDEDMLDKIISDISANLPGKMVQNSYYIDDNNLVITKGTSGITVDKSSLISKLKSEFANFTSNDEIIQIPVINSDPDEIDLDKIHSEIYKEAKDAYFEQNPFKVFAEIRGVDFDIDKSKKFLEEHPESTEYTFSLQYKEPKIKLKNLNINVFPDLLGTFSTRYDASNEDRSTNLNLAAEKIDGTIVSPGEEFSYNKIVGERSIAAGYKEAKIYSGGKIIDGLGGGICQVSSTLYNAVVFANLKVTERFNHQFITSYVSAGRDATVAYGVKDFRFINNRKYPIKINISINSGMAKVDIYGIKEETEYEISFDTETVSNIPYDTKYQIDSSLSAGTEKVKQRGVNGIIVNAYKIIKQNGITISKEFISKDKYNALDKVIAKSSE